jgi:hypothetical protein
MHFGFSALQESRGGGDRHTTYHIVFEPLCVSAVPSAHCRGCAYQPHAAVSIAVCKRASVSEDNSGGEEAAKESAPEIKDGEEK